MLTDIGNQLRNKVDCAKHCILLLKTRAKNAEEVVEGDTDEVGRLIHEEV